MISEILFKVDISELLKFSSNVPRTSINKLYQCCHAGNILKFIFQAWAVYISLRTC